MAGSKATIKPKEQRRLHAKSGNRCAMCHAVLVDANNDSHACIGENAHIYGEMPNSARYDGSLDVDFVNSDDNLIFLCANCHTKIDSEPEKYPVQLLQELKKSHEKWVIEKLRESTLNYGYAELEVLAKYILKRQSSNTGERDLDIIKLKDKISKNELGSMQGYIIMGLANMALIEEYFNKHPDETMASCIANTLKDHYLKAKAVEPNTEAVFEYLWKITSGENDDFNYRAAGLGILVYFFEKCEVFEK